MGHLPPLHRVTIGRTREVRGPDGMEMGIASVIMAGVVIMAMAFGARLVAMAQTLNSWLAARGELSLTPLLPRAKR
jgi:hypothetical protein